MGQLTASNLNLDIKAYDPKIDYNNVVKNSLLGEARIKILEKLQNK